MPSNLLRRREIASVQLAFQVLATDVVDRVHSAANSVFINQTHLSELKKASIDVRGGKVYSLITRNSNRGFGTVYFQNFKNPLVKENHPRWRKTHVHRRISSLSPDTSHGENQIGQDYSYLRLLGIQLSQSNDDPQIGTEPAGALARRFEKRTGEAQSLPCDGSGGYSAETMRTHNQPGKSSIDRGSDR